MSLKEFEKLHKEIEEKREKATGLFKIALKEALDDTLKLGISKIRWRQYTPYFNDGEACIFSVHEPVFYIDNGNVPLFFCLDEDDEDGAWYYLSYSNLEKHDPKYLKTIEKLNVFFSDLDNFYFLNCFDDHAQITYDGKEFEVDDHNHD